MSNQSATVSFTPPVNNGGTPITSYTATASPGGISATGLASPIIVTGLTNGVSYTFTVTATNAVGTGPASTPSNAVIPATVPSTMAAPTGVAGGGQVVVSFVPPFNGGRPITSYRVTASPGGATVSGGASPLTVTGLTNGTSYTFTVTATNSIGTSLPSPSSTGVIPATIPGTPVTPTATRGVAQATVSFVPPANGGSPILFYTVTSSPGGITQTGTASPIVVPGLTNGTTYTFTVKATNAIGTGPTSSPSNAVTPATIPSTMTAPSAVPGNTQATVSFSAPFNGGSAIISYTITSIPGGLQASGPTSPITVPGLTNGSSYTFTATATNAIGTSAPSPPSNAVVPAGSSATPVFNFSSFAGQGSLFSLPSSSITGSQLLVGTATGHTSAAAWYRTQQPNASFTTQFTFQATGLTVGTVPNATGFTFILQNGTSPPGTAGFVGLSGTGDANCDGYGFYDPALLGPSQDNNFVPSVGIIFDGNWNSQVQYPSGGNPSSTGLYVQGGPFGGFIPECDLNISGINLYTSHVFQCNIVYDDTLHVLAMTLLDTSTNAQARFEWPINIPACMAGNTTSWIGFGEGKVANTQQFINTWAYWTGFNTRLAKPTFSPAPGQYAGTQSVTVSGPVGATLYYTTNGLLPTSSSTQVTGPITVAANTNLQVVAIQSGFTDSLTAQATYKIGTANTINFPSGFAVNDGVIPCGHAHLTGSAILLTDSILQSGVPGGTTTIEVGNAWYSAPVNIQNFSTTFTLQLTGNGQGMTFIIAGSPIAPAANAPNWAAINGPTLIGGQANALGYGGLRGSGQSSNGIQNSVAVKFDMFSGNTTGLYTNGATPGSGGTSVSPVILNSGNPITCTLSYNGTTLSMTLTDTVIPARTFSTSFTVNIPAIVGGNTAYVGFGAGQGGAIAVQLVTNWTGF